MNVLKGRSQNPEALNQIIEILMCKNLNLNPMQLKKMAYEDFIKHKLIISTILSVEPKLLINMM